MTPLEYAAILHQKWQTRVSNTPPEKLFLKGCVIFLVFEEKNKSTKDTRIKLDIIARNGGQVATKYDPEIVTHIIPGASNISQKKVLQALGLKSLSEVPAEIHTVKWDWIVSGLTVSEKGWLTGSQGDQVPQMSIVKGKAKRKLQIIHTPTITVSHKINNVRNFSAYDSADDNDHDEPLVLPQESTMAGQILEASKTNLVPMQQDDDPLLPFYAKAREEALSRTSDDEPIIPLPEPDRLTTTSKLKGFQCDNKPTQVQEDSPNRDIIEKLAELREIHRDMGTDGDRWRVLGYQKAIGSLKTYPTRIRSREEALKLSGISDKTADKIMEIVRTGELQRIKYTKTQDLEAIRAFSGIYGVGTNIARKWFNQGLKSLDDLKRAVHDETLKLTFVQEIGLKFYDDINNRMPRSEAEEIFLKIKPLALSLDPKLSLLIMGSFRRGKATCGDIDILLTRPTDDGKTHAGVLLPLCNLLRRHGILTEDLAVPEDWHGLEAIYRGLCRRDESSRRRRIDILCIPYECRGAAQIYYTGDDIFNRSIRLKANKMNMSLNQRGLYQEVIRDPHDRSKKLSQGTLLCSDSERKIFEILGVPWQEPHERVRG
ncbi:Nucleotidyltransferase [Hysterangium stoloniferum]|nr:Nucleotidyltransferase [Hysterangium stoloniferum]